MKFTPARRPRTQSLCLAAVIAVLFSTFSASKAASLIISEFMAANVSEITDEDGDYSDWIEVYNPTDAAVSLQGWALSDDDQAIRKWVFPNVSIGGHTFLTVFASGKDRTNATAKLHTNFKLDAQGESVVLSDQNGEIISSFINYPPQIPNVSYGASMTTVGEAIAPFDGAGKLMIATTAAPTNWKALDFDDSSWPQAVMGIGYDRIPPGQVDTNEPPALAGDVTRPGDPTTPTSFNSPGSEGVTNAIDNNSSTKYLNFDKLNAGFTVTPSDQTSVVIGLKLTSANDAPERDPTSFILSGNDGSGFKEIARGSIPAFTARFQTVQVSFPNETAYLQYRLIFPTVVNAAGAVAMQIAEVEFVGRASDPAPNFAPYITTNIEADLFNKASSVYLREAFQFDTNRALENLTLRLRYDDGFAAYLNGTLISRSNAASQFAYNGFATTNRYRRDAVKEVRVSVNQFTSLLRQGTNVLALQGWNDRIDSPDFLLQAQLENSRFFIASTGYFQTPTPGLENGAGSAGIVTAAVLNQPHGFYTNAFDLTIYTVTDGATIRYTTNGSLPSATNGSTYNGPIRIDHTSTIRAAAFRDDWVPSGVTTATYIFIDDVVKQTQATAIAAGLPSTWASYPAEYGFDPRVIGPNDSYGGKYARTIKQDLQSLAAVSLVLDNADMFGSNGIYPNAEAHGEVWERPLSIELINPDGSVGFQENAGIRIQGGAFRRFDLSMKKSFRVIFREEYGDSELKFPLFGSNAAGKFQNFVLRANANDAWPYGGGTAVYARDAFAMESIRAMGSISSHTHYVHLYINGLYWGVYNLVERPDAAFGASYYGGERDTWDAINQDSAPDGNYDAWTRLNNALNDDMSVEANYQRIQGNNPDGTRNPAYENLIDVDSMIDYMIMNLFIGNVDWPHRNWWTARDRNDGDGFKFHPWDSETAMGFSGVDTDVTGVSVAVARPYSVLRANANFRMRFADHVYRHFYNGGAFYVNSASPAWNPAKPTNNVPAARFFAICEGIRSAIVGESARWGDSKVATPYTRDEHWTPARDAVLNSYLPQRSAKVLAQFRNAGLYPRTEPPLMNQRGGQVSPGFALTMSSTVGTIYYTTNGIDPRGNANALTYSGPVTINDLTVVKARVLNGTEWSALNEAHFSVGQPKLVLSELHYHPLRTSVEERAAGFLDNEAFEFIELWNNGTAASDMSAVAFSKGIGFNFSTSAVQRLEPNQYVLLVADRAAFEKRYGTGLPIAGVYSGHFDNNGERVQLMNGTNVVFDFTYQTSAPWPTTPDGDGPSLQPINPSGNLNFGTNWQASAVVGGSPGKKNPPQPVRIQGAIADATQLRFAFPGAAGWTYVISAADSLTAPQWTVVQTINALPADQPVEVQLDLTASAGSRFYRVTAQQVE